jgi:hypothetical protein
MERTLSEKFRFLLLPPPLFSQLEDMPPLYHSLEVLEDHVAHNKDNDTEHAGYRNFPA